jgi:pyruvate/2-oxoglutarate dehydrogenase complex dihydrolipoamide acyltransferase (E2) component
VSVTDVRPLRPRHTLSPRARRRAAEIGPSPTTPASFAVAEAEVDLTGLSGDILPYVAKAAAEAMPAGPVHLAAGPGAAVIRHADELSLGGLRRRLNEPGADPPTAGANLTLVLSGLIAETLPPRPGQAGTLVIGAIVDRPAIVRTGDGDPAIAIRSLARLTFAYHGEFERADAARFLAAVKRRLEAPWPSAG